jgi:hypothetical protein
MGSPSRSLALAALFALLSPSVASAQAPAPGTPAPPPPGGGGSQHAAGPPGDSPGGSGAAADDKPKPAASTGNVGGVSFNDKPARRAPVARVVLARLRAGRHGRLTLVLRGRSRARTVRARVAGANRHGRTIGVLVRRVRTNRTVRIGGLPRPPGGKVRISIAR